MQFPGWALGVEFTAPHLSVQHFTDKVISLAPGIPPSYVVDSQGSLLDGFGRVQTVAHGLIENNYVKHFQETQTECFFALKIVFNICFIIIGYSQLS